MNLRFLYRNLKARYRDQKQEIGALCAHLRAGDLALDCGANKGSYLWSLSRAVGAQGRVVAFEPQRPLAAYLRARVADCGMSNVQVEERGLSDHAGSMTLMVPGGGTSPGATLESGILQRETCEQYPVEVTTLDDYLAHRSQPVRALKLDVEGHEFKVLRGAEQMLVKDGPLLVFECEQRHLEGATVQDILDWLRARGYDGDFIRAGLRVPVSEFRAELHQRQDGERFWDAPDYCNNFILRRD